MDEYNAVVLGGYVNAYGIIRELHECGVRTISLLHYKEPSLASYSRFLTYKAAIDLTKNDLITQLSIIKEKTKAKNLVIYPTDDIQLELLKNVYEDIKSFSFIPLNPDTIPSVLDKEEQYCAARKVGIPTPSTYIVRNIAEVEDSINASSFPVLIKPTKRENQDTEVFRNIFLTNYSDYEENLTLLKRAFQKQISLMVSDYIPGDDDNIYAYVAYRNKEGIIVNEWVGKKISQYPKNFGVFSTATNSAPPIIATYGRALLNEINLFGINEPEFKFDPRDGKYKLMEINLRSMMWHRLGNRSGVTLHYTQYLDAQGITPPPQRQNLNRSTKLVYLKHELLNLITERNYFKTFAGNLFPIKDVSFAVWNWRDPLPAIFDGVHFFLLAINKFFKRYICFQK